MYTFRDPRVSRTVLLICTGTQRPRRSVARRVPCERGRRTHRAQRRRHFKNRKGPGRHKHDAPEPPVCLSRDQAAPHGSRTVGHFANASSGPNRNASALPWSTLNCTFPRTSIGSIPTLKVISTGTTRHFVHHGANICGLFSMIVTSPTPQGFPTSIYLWICSWICTLFLSFQSSPGSAPASLSPMHHQPHHTCVFFPPC